MTQKKHKLIDRYYKESYEVIFRNILSSSNNGYYDEAALPSYTHSNKLMAWLFWNRVSCAFNLFPSDKNIKTVLDFGCGGGITFKAFHTLGIKVTGCDIEHQNLAQTITQKLDISTTIVKTLDSIEENSMDCIFALDVLEHIENLDEYIEKLKRVSKPNAVWILSGPTENIFYKAGRLLAGFSGHYHCRNIYQIEKAFETKSLHRETAKTLYWPIPLFRVSRWICP